MVRKVFNIQLDLKQASTNPRMIVVGGDTANFFLVTLTDDGEPVDLTDCRVIAVFSTSAGLAAQDGGSDEGGISIGGLHNNEITIELFNGSYSYDGLTQCEIQVYSGEDMSTLATSAKFSFRANRPILNDESIVQTREFPILTSLISEVKELRDAYDSIIKENGDMTMEVYDVDENGIVDDAERLGGELPEHYATSEGVAAIRDTIRDTISVLRVDLDAVGEVVETLTPDDIGAATVRDYRVTIPASGWSASAPYTQTLLVPGLTAEIAPELWFVPPDTAEAREAQRDAAACISLIETGADSLTVTCDEDLPEVDVQILLREVF